MFLKNFEQYAEGADPEVTEVAADLSRIS
jgi:hypothetical protein